jgi:DNA polymerase V
MFSGFYKDLAEHCQKLKQAMQNNLSLPVCVGLGPTKTLAKVANHYAKKHKKSSSGVIDLRNEAQRQWALEHLDVQDIWGVGQRLSNKLKLQGINTAWELHNCDYKTLQRMFSVNMERTILELRGQACWELAQQPETKKSILNSRSFGNPITEKSDLKEALAYHATRCCEKLRKQSSLANHIQLYLYTREKQRLSITLSLAEPTDDTSLFLQMLEYGLEKIYQAKEVYKKAGVVLYGIVPNRGFQSDIFNNTPQRPELMESLDSINSKYGKDTIKFGSLGFKKRWAMRADARSPRYTSRWSDIISVK